MNLTVLCVLGLSWISCCYCCLDDNLWDLVTCGPVALSKLSKIRSNNQYDMCGSDTLSAGLVNRDVILAQFQTCHQGNMLTNCTAKQQEGLAEEVAEGALSAIPCDVVNDASPPPSCANEYIQCIFEAVAKMVEVASRGKPCVCFDRDLVKTATLGNCVNLASPLSSCAGLSSDHKTALETSEQSLINILDTFDCSAINTAECQCYDKVKSCIVDGLPTIDGGDMDGFLELGWSLIEVTALQNQQNPNAIEWEKTRAWIRYQDCRTLGYPDQLDRAVKCIEKYVPQVNSDPATCDVSFPETLAFAEHDASTTFYQTVAAAAKNIQDFCHVWCRNTTLWTGEMLTCLSEFHPPGWTPADEADNVITQILDSNDAQLKAICDANPTGTDSQLKCAADKVKECPYLPYHLIIADKYSFQRTLTSSDAMEAIYRILQACDKNATAWALTAITARDDDKKPTGGNNGDGFTGFFNDTTRIAPLEYGLLLLLALYLVTLTKF